MMRCYVRIAVCFTVVCICLLLAINSLDSSSISYNVEERTVDSQPELKNELLNEQPSQEEDQEIADIDSKGDEFKKMMKEVETENTRRLDRVENVCRKYGLGLYKNSQEPSPIKHPPTPQYQVFYFDRVNRWSLCPIYKAGSTSWLHNLLKLAGLTDDDIEASGKQLSELARQFYPELDPNTAEQELKITTKIMTVRHPFERVLSAYRDKLENINQGWEHGTKHFYQAFGSKIVKKYRPGGNSTSTDILLHSSEVLRDPYLPQPAGIEPTFQEFVRYLIDSNLVSKADDHWIPYYLYCTPCLLHYEFIAKTETLGADQTYVIRALGLHDKINATWRHRTQFIAPDDPYEVSGVAKIYFKQLTQAQILQLHGQYRIDFELFGYDFKSYLEYAKDAED